MSTEKKESLKRKVSGRGRCGLFSSVGSTNAG